MSKKLTTFFNVLKQSHEVIETLKASGIDVEQIVHVSNAQGPLAKILHGVIVGAAAASAGNPNTHADQLVAEFGPLAKELTQLPTRSTQKQLNPSRARGVSKKK